MPVSVRGHGAPVIWDYSLKRHYLGNQSGFGTLASSVTYTGPVNNRTWHMYHKISDVPVPAGVVPGDLLLLVVSMFSSSDYSGAYGRASFSSGSSTPIYGSPAGWKQGDGKGTGGAGASGSSVQPLIVWWRKADGTDADNISVGILAHHRIGDKPLPNYTSSGVTDVVTYGQVQMLVFKDINPQIRQNNLISYYMNGAGGDDYSLPPDGVSHTIFGDSRPNPLVVTQDSGSLVVVASARKCNPNDNVVNYYEEKDTTGPKPTGIYFKARIKYEDDTFSEFTNVIDWSSLSTSFSSVGAPDGAPSLKAKTTSTTITSPPPTKTRWKLQIEASKRSVTGIVDNVAVAVQIWKSTNGTDYSLSSTINFPEPDPSTFARMDPATVNGFSYALRENPATNQNFSAPYTTAVAYKNVSAVGTTVPLPKMYATVDDSLYETMTIHILFGKSEVAPGGWHIGQIVVMS